MVSPSRIIAIVICSVSTHSKDTCQGTMHVQSCSLRAARRVCMLHTLFPSVHSSDLGPHVRLSNKTMLNRAFCSFSWGVWFFGYFLHVEIFEKLFLESKPFRNRGWDFMFQQLFLSGCLFSVHTYLPLPALGACLPALDACLPALGACRPAFGVKCVVLIVICCSHLCLALLACHLCLVDGALTESGNCSDVWNVSHSSAHYTVESRRGTRTAIRKNSLLSSLPVRSELMVFHHASALAQEPAPRIPKWKDLGPLRLPCPGTDEPRGTDVATNRAESFEC